jgi:hypothetical protein
MPMHYAECGLYVEVEEKRDFSSFYKENKIMRKKRGDVAETDHIGKDRQNPIEIEMLETEKRVR